MTTRNQSRPKPDRANNRDSAFALASYGYDLPSGLIAQHPAPRRDAARLMVVDRAGGTIAHDRFSRVGRYLPGGTTLAINNSKVIPARLLGVKERSQGAVEVFLLKPLADGYSFEALLKPLKKIHAGDVLIFDGGLRAVLADKDKRIVRFERPDVLSFLEESGHIPLPPYIQRSDTAQDRKDYQTVYACRPGSVAAPTAGLHFTRGLMTRLTRQGHAFIELTLHINYGTFKPVETEDIRTHPMHSEWYRLEAADYAGLRKAKAQGRKVAAVGTTSCRVLEAAAATGQLEGETNIFMYPGFRFKMTDILITNFHLPHSTLLMLVCAFGGYDLIMRAYREAIQEQYRFYSYGDAMLIV